MGGMAAAARLSVKGHQVTLLGFATLLFGLVVIMPILGHASWHAYRDLVE